MDYVNLQYGTSEKTIDQIEFHFSTLLDICFEKRSSDYFGNYSIYKGLFADKIKIQNNYLKFSDDYGNSNYKNLTVIVDILIEGRSKDVKSRTKIMTDLIKKHMTYLELLAPPAGPSVF
ncbi:hypothetical protein AX766_07115 [Flavobacterium covae]|uniref:hypothetical protein n=1 Tax=Flavobacterium covae TaxID=2906076 RepID=UPI0007C18EBE|nr:hypothetical protein [Flavobacterium covae]AND64197.1 hypothetical protein AX766_07115 [Flavobacterium covae]